MSRAAPPVVLEVRASRWHRALVLVALVGAAIAIPLSGLSWPWRFALWLLAMLLFLRGWRATGAWDGCRLVMYSDQRSRIRRPDGNEAEFDVVDARILGPLIALSIRIDGGTREDLALFPDSADAEDLRRLRVQLRHGLTPGTKDDAPIQ